MGNSVNNLVGYHRRECDHNIYSSSQPYFNQALGSGSDYGSMQGLQKLRLLGESWLPASDFPPVLLWVPLGCCKAGPAPNPKVILGCGLSGSEARGQPVGFVGERMGACREALK